MVTDEKGRFIPITSPPACHPDRKRFAKDLCRQCYNNAAQKRRNKGTYIRPPKTIRMAECHPTERYVAKGLCFPCSKTYYWNKRKSKDTYREENLRSDIGHYGVTLEEYREKLEFQQNRCAICKTSKPAGKNRTRFDIDHSHLTGKFRGLLCLNCNRLLSAASDRIEVLLEAIEYLRFYEEDKARKFVGLNMALVEIA